MLSFAGSSGRHMDLRRRAQIVEAKPNEHDGEVIVQNVEDFDLQKTIFKTVASDFVPLVKSNFAKELFWSDKAVAGIEAKTAKMRAENPKWAELKDHSPALIKFMMEECEFNIEHADGSFMDHLQFCYEYCSVHMPQHSPIPAFLHSIMGVGTNLFPMKLEQKPRLAQLVSAEDLLHIEVFPSVVRLLVSRILLNKLMAMSDQEIANINGLECYRLIGPNMDHDGQVGKSDNMPLNLNAHQLWVQLNYQLIHSMDFLPAVGWKEKFDSSLLHVFFDLHRVLKRAGKLMARIDVDSDKWVTEQTPEAMKVREEITMLNVNYSGKIGHKLECKIMFKDAAGYSKL